VKRLFWFCLGITVGAIGYQRLAEKIQRDGVLTTMAEAQAWAWPRIAKLLQFIGDSMKTSTQQGGNSDGIRRDS